MTNDPFENYEINVEQTGPEEIPINLEVSVEAIRRNLKLFEVYAKVDKYFPKLEEVGIPKDLDWKSIVSEYLLPSQDNFFGCLVNKIEDIRIEGKNISLDCVIYDPYYNNY